MVQEELSAHIGGEVTAVVAAEGHHEAAQPGQSEVVIWSRDLVLTNHSSPGGVQGAGEAADGEVGGRPAQVLAHTHHPPPGAAGHGYTDQGVELFSQYFAMICLAKVFVSCVIN